MSGPERQIELPSEHRAVMTVARPPVVSQTAWDAALAAVTEREKAVDTMFRELAAARKRMPMVNVVVQTIGSIWSLWSLTPYGGQSDDEDLPAGWPHAPQSFLFRRHDEFDDPPPPATVGADRHDAS